MPDTWGSAGWGDSERSWDRTDGNKWDQGSDRNKDGEPKWDRGWGRVDERGDAKWERGDDLYSNGWGHSTSSETPASSSWQRRGETWAKLEKFEDVVQRQFEELRMSLVAHAHHAHAGSARPSGRPALRAADADGATPLATPMPSSASPRAAAKMGSDP